jgi:hypothetical protein
MLSMVSPAKRRPAKNRIPRMPLIRRKFFFIKSTPLNGFGLYSSSYAKFALKTESRPEFLSERIAVLQAF